MTALALMLGLVSCTAFLWCVYYHPLVALAWFLIAAAIIPFAGRQLRLIGDEDAQS